MNRIPAPLLATALSAGLVCTAVAATTTATLRVPGQYDGAWTIVATTDEGPCAPSTSYRVQIKDSDASIPGDEIDIDGGVSAGGTVHATITKGANKVPIAGSLDAAGGGLGTWHTAGGLVACRGSWRAKRSG